MLYDAEKKQDMLDTLNNRVSSIVDVCVSLIQEGYIPNKNKFNKLSWTTIMIDAFDNIDVLSVEQHNKLETLYNKVNTKMWSNYNYINKYWNDNATLLKLGDQSNNWYLKISGQKDGTNSYQDNPPEIDDSGKVISLSRYQKLTVQIFATRCPSELN